MAKLRIYSGIAFTGYHYLLIT